MNKKKEMIFYHKLRNDEKWYIETFLNIKNKKAEIVPFKLNIAQNIVMEQVNKDKKENKPKRYIVLKARQMGLSTLFEGLIFQDTSTKENKNALIIAHEESASSNLFQMSKLFYEYLPDEIRPMKKYSNGKILAFENPETDESKKKENPGLRSKITIATAGAGEVGRSSTIHCLHASEVAFFPDAKTTMLGLLQAVPDEPNTLVVLESTANGIGDWFHSMWQKSVKGENEFTPIFLPWFIDPGYSRAFRSDAERDNFIKEITTFAKDQYGNEIKGYEYELMEKNNLTFEQLNWRRWTIKNKCEGDEELFMQEYPSTPEEAFLSTGRPKFPIKVLREYQTKTRPAEFRGYLVESGEDVIVLLQEEKGYMHIWEKPIEGRTYSIGADVAEGLVHGDYSCGVVFDDETFDMVAMWHGHIDPDLFGEELVKLGKYYNYAFLGVEANNHGLTTLTAIKKLEYWNLFFSKTYDKINESSTKKVGWYTNLKTKPLMIDKLTQFIREKYLGIYSDMLISEMFTYIIDDKGGTNAQEGCNDDIVMATAIALQLLLEHKGENYVPEIPIDERKKVSRTFEIVDPLFESDSLEDYAI